MHKITSKDPCVLIITGPTASGKTALSELVIHHIPGEIINADVGQFYVPLSIGTAKPDLSTVPYRAHAFNILNEPRDVSVVAYRSLVVDLVEQIVNRRHLPIIVGGSLFYIKSLFFPPYDLVAQPADASRSIVWDETQPLWQQLQSVDSKRAAQLHPNDAYRIKRALAIWQKTGMKPSACKPLLQVPFKTVIVFVSPDRAILNANIKKRVTIMMQQGWIEEAEKFVGTPWEPFLQKKGLIGYPELIAWIRHGKPMHELNQVIATIQNETIAYAKRQVTFWKSFAKQLGDADVGSADACSLVTISEVSDAAVRQIERVLAQGITKKNDFS